MGRVDFWRLVGSMAMDDIDILARTIYGEARGEKTIGKKAIACVVLNRYKSGKWFAGKTIAETCQKKYQFSCWNPTDPNRQKILEASDSELAEYKKIAEDFITGKEKDFLCGSTHYHTLNIKPAWANGKKADFQIGQHLFYVGIE